MIRRLLVTAAGALALAILPTAAMAYDAPGYDTTVTDASPAPGETFTLTTRGATPGALLTLTVTASGYTQTYTATADAEGVASFALSLPAAGTYTLTVTDADGRVLGDEVITVAASGNGGVASPGLSDTGFDGAGLAVGAGALILAGAGAVVVARRRQLSQAGV